MATTQGNVRLVKIDSDREANMWAFTDEALDLFIEFEAREPTYYCFS